MIDQRVRFGVGLRGVLAIQLRRIEGLLEEALHAPPVGVQIPLAVRPVDESHRLGETLAAGGVGRDQMGLFIAPRLDAVLHAAQKPIGLAQLVDRVGRQHIELAEPRQHLQNRTHAQPAVASAVDQLERLADEFDLADAAPAELDIRVGALLLQFVLDQPLHRAQRIDDAEIDIAAIDERPQDGHQLASRDLRSGNHARLDHRVTLPGARLAFIICLEGGKTGHQRTGLAERSQAGIDAKHETVGGAW